MRICVFRFEPMECGVPLHSDGSNPAFLLSKLFEMASSLRIVEKLDGCLQERLVLKLL
jgi:hypothetical protein